MSDEEERPVPVSFTFHGAPYTRYFCPDATITDLSLEISKSLHIQPSNQKFMISKVGLLKTPFKDPELQLSTIADKKITLMGSTSDEVSAMSIASDNAARRVYLRDKPLQKVKAYMTRDWAKEQEESQYTFTTLRPLTYLPNSARSLQFLQRLKDDVGIKSVMRKYKFTVPLLTEMDPLEHTQAGADGVSRTLGLNRNKGEIIELRLRTDAYDGYRDYKTIRRTLCHELTHNVHGPHDRNFWDLCKQIEREVEGADWRKSGRTLGDVNVYEDAEDQSKWSGGEYVLGVSASNETQKSSSQGLGLREALAKAAEKRIKQEKRHDEGPSKKPEDSLT
ncbi:hypothetical protein K3495_g1359 [Podosphaera aphanis]|nr:hypothetical protein K3495_g1359 [Podosphaera aphanis]